MSERAARLIPMGILFAALIALFHRLFIGEVIFWGTPILQFYPWQKLAFDQLRQARLPLWNPLVGNGSPLLANYQTAVFYPPNWIHFVVPSEYAMGLIGVAHLAWAGFGMSAYLRRLGIGPLGQGVGTLSFALCGYLMSRFGFLSITTAVAWLPWLMWAVDGLAAPLAGSRARQLPALAVVVAMQLLAGHAQTTFYSLLMASAYATFRCLGRAGVTGWVSLARLACVAIGIALGISAAAVQLAPTAELMVASQRATGVEAVAGLSYSFWPWRLLTLLAPNLFGSPATGNFDGYGMYWEDAIYVGLLPLIMAGHGMVRWAREWRSGDNSSPIRAAPFFALALPIVFVFALGQNTPIFLWLFENRVPGFVTFQAPTRWTLLIEFALCVLAALGTDGWRSSERGLYWTRLLTAGGFAVFVGSWIAVNAMGGARSGFVPALISLGTATIVGGALGLVQPLAEQRRRARAVWEVAVWVYIAADLGVAHWGLTPTIPPSYYHQGSRLAAVASAVAPGQRFAYLPSEGELAKFGVPHENRLGFLSGRSFQAEDRAHWDALRDSLLPNLGMLDGVPSASVFDPLRVGDYDSMMARIDALDEPAQVVELQKMNVGLLISASGCGSLEQVGVAEMVVACAVPGAWPRALVADCASIADGSLDCERADGEAVIMSESSTEIDLRVGSERATFLVLLDTFYPGWQATVNGNEAAIQRANGAFRAVAVPAGESTVALSYQPASLVVGAAISGAALIALASWWALAAFAAKRHADASSRNSTTDKHKG